MGSIIEFTDNGILYLRVIDHGIGIPEEDIKKMNALTSPEKRQGTHKEKGTGLGTLIAANYLKLHELNVRFDSIQADESNGGFGETTVTILFDTQQYRVI